MEVEMVITDTLIAIVVVAGVLVAAWITGNKED